MNLLGHAYLSFDNDDILCGNMMGDYVKGKKILETYPEKIKEGILLHRKIDEFTDAYLPFIMATNIFRPDYRLYSGAIVDIVFDHFLANDPKYFNSDDSLKAFTNNVYKRLRTKEEFMPEDFKKLLNFLEEKQALYKYRSMGGLKIALTNLVHRMKYDVDAQTAIDLTVQYYYELNQYYFDLMDSIIPFVKKELKHT